MFEPGQKVMVIKSNFTKKTGPRVGSLGFVSDFNVNFYGLRFNRIVWYQFGNQKTHRMETGHFGMILPGQPARFSVDLRGMGCRRGGTLIPIFEKRKIEDMESLEFNCWLYSITRLYRGHKSSDKIRNKMAFSSSDFNPKIFSQHKFSIKNRIELANIARELKLIAFRTYKRDIEHYLEHSLERIHRMTRDGFSTKRMVSRMITKRGVRHEYFYELFTRMVYFNVVGQMIIKNINTNTHPYNGVLRQMWREWRRLHPTSS